MLRLLLLTIVTVVLAGAAQAGGRFALVISVDKYTAMRPLRNAVNDGRAVREALEALDFEVTPSFDDDLATLRRKLARFREDTEGADLALVFFSGHGVEIAGENRLLPADADAESLSRLRETSLPLEEIRDLVAEVGRKGLILLDACRNDPFGAAGDEQGRGGKVLSADVAQAARPGLLRAPGRTGKAGAALIAFSAAPGAVASDGADGNSPFSAALAKYLPTDGLDIRSVLTLVRQEVYERSNAAQLPYVEDGLPGVFFAAQTGELPERERLLLAMADITPDLRSEVERIAADTSVPLAPLYATLIASDYESLSVDERAEMLSDSAAAFLDTRRRLADVERLLVDRPEVERLRLRAQESLDLGAFELADSLIEEAIGLVDRARREQAGELVGTTLAQVDLLRAKASVAVTRFDFEAAADIYERGLALHRGLSAADMTDAGRQQRVGLLGEIGRLQLQVGAADTARATFVEMEAAARHILEARDPADGFAAMFFDQDRAAVADSLSGRGRAQFLLGDTQAALAAYGSALKLRQEVASSPLAWVSWRSQADLASDLEAYVDVLRSTPMRGIAAQAAQSAVRLRRKIAAVGSPPESADHDLIHALVTQGDIKRSEREFEAAMEAYREAEEIARRLFTKNGGEAAMAGTLSMVLQRVSADLKELGDPAAALVALEEAHELHRSLLARSPSDWTTQFNAAVFAGRFAELHRAIGDTEAALRLYREEEERWRALRHRQPAHALVISGLAGALFEAGDILVKRKDFDEALGRLAEARILAEETAGRQSGDVPADDRLTRILVSIGDVHIWRGEFRRGAAAYREALGRMRLIEAGLLAEKASFPASAIAYLGATAVAGLSTVLDAARAVADARIAQDDALDDVRFEMSDTLWRIGGALRRSGDTSGARLAYIERADLLRPLVSGSVTDDWRAQHLFDTLIRYGRLVHENTDAARVAYSEAREIAQRLGSVHATVDWRGRYAMSLYCLALAGEQRRRNLEEARAILDELAQTGQLGSLFADLPERVRQALEASD